MYCDKKTVLWCLPVKDGFTHELFLAWSLILGLYLTIQWLAGRGVVTLQHIVRFQILYLEQLSLLPFHRPLTMLETVTVTMAKATQLRNCEFYFTASYEKDQPSCD